MKKIEETQRVKNQETRKIEYLTRLLRGNQKPPVLIRPHMQARGPKSRKIDKMKTGKKENAGDTQETQRGLQGPSQEAPARPWEPSRKERGGMRRAKGEKRGPESQEELQKNPQERRMEGRGGHKMTLERDGGERKRKRG